MRELDGIIEVAVGFVVFFVVGVINSIINAVIGTAIVCIATIPIVLLYPGWELVPWIRLHTLSLVFGIFVIQLILPRRGVDSPTVKPPARYRVL